MWQRSFNLPCCLSDTVKSVNRTYDGLTIIHYNLKVDVVTQILTMTVF